MKKISICVIALFGILLLMLVNRPDPLDHLAHIAKPKPYEPPTGLDIFRLSEAFAVSGDTNTAKELRHIFWMKIGRDTSEQMRKEAKIP